MAGMSDETANIGPEVRDDPGEEEKIPSETAEIGREISGAMKRRNSDLSSNNSPNVHEYLYSTISMESLDLDVPSSYKVETVDFPSSPEELKKISGGLMPIELGRRTSEEEDDKSIYSAQLMSNGQDVRLVKDEEVAAKASNHRKVISVPVETNLEVPTDTESISAMPSCDTDLDSIPDSPDELEESILSQLDDMDIAAIPELTAAEEAEESRSWRTFTLAGADQTIDLRVLEPYKRVVSHGGYLSQGSRNAIIVFSACFLPDRSRVDYDYVMNNLFMYVISTLDQLVTDDYVLVYLHGATQRSSMPKFSWLKQCYHMIDRKLRKNLKGLYLVHPTFWLKTLAIMTKPFVSSKFSKKLFFVYSLSELLRKVPLEKASIPDRVIKYDFDLFKDESILEN